MSAREPDPPERAAGEADPQAPPLAATVAEPVAPFCLSPAAPLEHLEPGTTVGRYLVLERLGAGGMGVVYTAYDRTLDRKVALKILRRDRSGPHAETRLVREAQALAQLAHPNVVAVHDVGEVGGHVLVAMEFVAGATLRQWLDRERRPWREVLRVFLAAGRGLAAAHAVGLVHRDFKPENVLLGEDGRVRVVDFGLARRAAEVSPPAPSDASAGAAAAGAEPSALATPLTVAGALVGTPAYMSPEQYRGEATSPRSDQFAFATALYEALYGEHPFRGGATSDLRGRIVEGRVREEPSATAVPPWLRRVLLRALAPDPEARYPSMEALLAALAEDPAARRRRRLVAAAAAVLVIAAGAAALWTLRARGQLCAGGGARLAEVWNPAVAQTAGAAFAASGKPYAAGVWRAVAARLSSYGAAWAAQHREACEATRLRGEQSEDLLDRRMACLERRRLELGALVGELGGAGRALAPEAVDRAADAVSSLGSLAECADAGLLTARVRPPSDPAVAARVESVEADLGRAKALWATGRFPEALTVAEGAAGQARELGYRPAEATALVRLGDVLDEEGRYAEEKAKLREALVAAEAGGDAPNRIRAQVQMAWVLGYRLGEVEEAGFWMRLAEAGVVGLGGDAELAALVEVHQAIQMFQEGAYAEAAEHGLRALPALAATYGEESYEVGGAENDVGLALMQAGRYDDSRAHLERSIAIYRQLYGGEHPKVAEVQTNLALLLWTTRDFEGSLREGLAALAIRRKVLPADHPDLAVALNNIGQSLQNLGRYGEARTYMIEALGLVERTRGPDHPDVAGMLNNLAYSYRVDHRYDEAAETYRRSLAVYEKALGPRHPLLAYPLVGLGITALERGRPAEAIAPLERAYALRRAGEVQPKDRAGSTFQLARALAAAGRDRPRARRLAAEARAIYAGLGEGFAAQRAEVEKWLADDGGAGPG
jgi:eukaryotic-like serine/threonine-protein kinase